MGLRCILRKQSHLLSLTFERAAELFLAVKSTLIRRLRADRSLQGCSVCRFQCDLEMDNLRNKTDVIIATSMIAFSIFLTGFQLYC